MTTRYTARSRSRFGVPGLPTGYDGKSTPELTIPPVGIEDVDKALYDLFDSGIRMAVGGAGTETKKVPVVFYAGEKWVVNKKLRALRDRNGSLILPLVTAIRTRVLQDPSQDITGRGINQQTGEIVIHRRLDKSDRGYQNLINRLFLRHQTNLGVSPRLAESTGQLTTLRQVGELAMDPVVRQGGLLANNRMNNLFETIVVPAPQFFTAQYDVVLWAQYTSHMNQMLEALFSSFLPQGNCWRLDTDKGYWFIATIDGNQYDADLNADDYSQTERVIKYRFSVKVPGYVFASDVPGAPVPLKRYVSSPTISFETVVQSAGELSGGDVTEPFLGADDPSLPLDDGSDGRSRRTDQRRVGSTRLYPQKNELSPLDPALQALPRGSQPAIYQRVVGIDSTGNKVTRLMRVTSRNSFTGETVLTGADLGSLTIVHVED